MTDTASSNLNSDSNVRVNAAGEVVTREDLQSGFKADGGKPRTDLLPPRAMLKLLQFFNKNQDYITTIMDKDFSSIIQERMFEFMAGAGVDSLVEVAAVASIWLELVEGTGVLRGGRIPPKAMLLLGDLFRIGAEKYEDRNWEKGMKWGRPIAALLRHLYKYELGEDYDEVDGQHHVTSVLWCAMVLIEYCLTGAGTDDRTSLKCRDEQVLTVSVTHR